MGDWRPTARLQTLQLRARLLQRIRAFFNELGVLEVDTPLMSRAATSDVQIESFTTRDTSFNRSLFFHTSPEFAMKRLLAAGSGAIYQLCKVLRMGEAGGHHNPEFTLLEWYQPDYDHHRLMDEVDALVREVLQDYVALGKTQRLSYREVFQQYLELDPFSATAQQLQEKAQAEDIQVMGLELSSKDPWLDLLMTHVIEPRLPQGCPVFIFDYPASQAALSKIRQGTPPVAERFELYINSMELANGFHELTDATEQRQRFENDLAIRKAQGLPFVPPDESFLQALQAGLPECAGVALGFDRLVMLAAGVNAISEVLAFDYERA